MTEEEKRRYLELTAKEKQGNLFGMVLTGLLSIGGTLFVNWIFGKYTEEKTELLIESTTREYLEKRDSTEDEES